MHGRHCHLGVLEDEEKERRKDFSETRRYTIHLMFVHLSV